MFRPLCLALLSVPALLAAPCARAQAVPPPGVDGAPAKKAEQSGLLGSVGGSISTLWRWSDARMRGIFDVFLPDTQERRTWRLTLDPHFGDLFRRDHFRTPVGFIYGLSDHAEGSFELDTYLPNVFKDGAGSGISNLRGGFKYAWKPKILNMSSAATGLELVHPLTGAPDDLNEGVNRSSFYVTLARPGVRHKDIENFLSLSYDLITPSSATGTIREDKPQDDFFKISPGVLYRKNGTTYGLTLAWEHTVDGPPEDFFTVTPSIVFMVPERYTFGSPGQWQLGTALESKFYDGQTDFSFRVRVRWFVDLKKAWSDWKENRQSARASPTNDNGSGR